MDKKHVHKYLKLKNTLINKARQIRLKGYQHRGFLVGCATLVFDGTQYRIFTSANFMPIKGWTKVCAEQGALVAARNQGSYPLIVAIVVCGEPQPDEESGITSTTLHPCGNCRRFFRGFPEVKADTIICTVSVDEKGPQDECTFFELWQLHTSEPLAA